MKKTRSEPSRTLTRRAFARGAALATAGAVVLPKLVESQQTPPPTTSSPVAAPSKQPPETQEKKLSPAAEAEVNAKFDEILRRYGPRLSPQQKEEIRRQLGAQVKALGSIRQAALDNSVQPATVLKIGARRKS